MFSTRDPCARAESIALTASGRELTTGAAAAGSAAGTATARGGSPDTASSIAPDTTLTTGTTSRRNGDIRRESGTTRPTRREVKRMKRPIIRALVTQRSPLATGRDGRTVTQQPPQRKSRSVSEKLAYPTVTPDHPGPPHGGFPAAPSASADRPGPGLVPKPIGMPLDGCAVSAWTREGAVTSVRPDALSLTLPALAEPTRRAILAWLTHGPATVRELAEPFSLTGPAVSRQELVGRGVDVGAVPDGGSGVVYVGFEDPDRNSSTVQQMPWRTGDAFWSRRSPACPGRGPTGTALATPLAREGVSSRAGRRDTG